MGEKEAVALMSGVTQDERVESESSSERKEEQEEVMLAGMRMLSVEFAVLLDCAETAPARARAKRAYFIMASASVMSVWVAVWPVSGSAGGWEEERLRSMRCTVYEDEGKVAISQRSANFRIRMMKIMRSTLLSM